jgi:hypothetical protein
LILYCFYPVKRSSLSLFHTGLKTQYPPSTKELLAARRKYKNTGFIQSPLLLKNSKSELTEDESKQALVQKVSRDVGPEKRNEMIGGG